MDDVLATFLALCGATILLVLGIMWYLDLWNIKDDKDEEPPTFI